MLTIDWPTILGEIALCLGDEDAQGRMLPCSTYALAERLKVPRGTLRGWMDGSSPKWEDGERILDEWSLLTCKARIFAPRVSVFSAARVRLDSA